VAAATRSPTSHGGEKVVTSKGPDGQGDHYDAEPGERDGLREDDL